MFLIKFKIVFIIWARVFYFILMINNWFEARKILRDSILH